MAFVSTCPFDRTLSCPWQAAQLPPLTPALDMSSLASAHNRRPAAKNTSRQNKTGASFFIFTNCSFRVIVYTRHTKETGWPEGKIKTSGQPAIRLTPGLFSSRVFAGNTTESQRSVMARGHLADTCRRYPPRHGLPRRASVSHGHEHRVPELLY